MWPTEIHPNGWVHIICIYTTKRRQENNAHTQRQHTDTHTTKNQHPLRVGGLRGCEVTKHKPISFQTPGVNSFGFFSVHHRAFTCTTLAWRRACVCVNVSIKYDFFSLRFVLQHVHFGWAVNRPRTGANDALWFTRRQRSRFFFCLHILPKTFIVPWLGKSICGRRPIMRHARCRSAKKWDGNWS